MSPGLAFLPSLDAAGLTPLSLQDAEQLRLLLQGDSVIDWRRLAFRDLQQVNDFLRLVELRLEDPLDEMRLRLIYRKATRYLQDRLGMVLCDEVQRLADLRELFLMASRRGGPQRCACVLLKVMHIIHHVAGRELLFRLQVSSDELFHEVETKVFDAIDGMKQRGIRVLNFASSRKSADSIVTKLLSRPDSIAREVHDRLRFRIITETLSDVFSALIYLTREVIPFNYVVPGESRDDLLNFERLFEQTESLSHLKHLLQRPKKSKARPQLNHFSATQFQMINFVVDLPVRVDAFATRHTSYTAEEGAVAFVLAELQFMDAATDQRNREGEAAHDRYRERKHDRVRARLLVD
ncbi:TIGR04552 family protein [Myxococcota bacterium]|nr:TIGR04552 family protein [Myxococcota bacterium]